MGKQPENGVKNTVSKANQIVIDKLKEMRATGEPVWVTFKGLRLKIRPDTEEDIFYPSTQDTLFKFKGRLHVASLSGKYTSYLYVWMGLPGGPPPPNCSIRLRWKNILAIIEEYHVREPTDSENGPH